MNKPTFVIEIQGGNLQGIYCTDPTTQSCTFKIIDHDNIQGMIDSGNDVLDYLAFTPSTNPDDYIDYDKFIKKLTQEYGRKKTQS